MRIEANQWLIISSSASRTMDNSNTSAIDAKLTDSTDIKVIPIHTTIKFDKSSNAQPEQNPHTQEGLAIDEFSDKIRVWVRIRPPQKYEFTKEIVVRQDFNATNQSRIVVEDGLHTIQSYYDKVFSNESTQKDVFEFAKPAISSVIDGFNWTVFAYGQTGSGKTHII